MPRQTLGMSREDYLEAVGEEVEPAGRKPAPDPLRSLQLFMNTYNVEYPDRDRLATVASATRWMKGHGLLEADTVVDEAGRAALVAAREAFRILADPHASKAATEDATRILVEASRRAQLVIRPTPQASILEATAPGIDGAIGSLLSQAHDAMAAGTWKRLKACKQCGYAFYDRSKNRSGEWCAMSVCGNRVKNRSYRARTS